MKNSENAIIKGFNFILILFLSLNTFSQSNLFYDNNLSSFKNYFKENYGVSISFPKKVKDLKMYSKPWKVRKDKYTGAFYGPFFLTKDKNCLIAFQSTIFGISNNLKNKNPQTFYFHAKGHVTAEIVNSLGFYYKANNPINNIALHKYVDIVFGKKAREKYNADAYSISDLPDSHKTIFLDKEPEALRKEKFPYCTSLFIQKDKRAVLDIKFFFTEKGFKKREKYIKMLDKHIWFDENFKPKKED